MKRILLTIFFSFSLLLLSLGQVSAKALKHNPMVSASYVPARNSVIATFTNLKGIKSVSYDLTYTGNNIPQGVSGNLIMGKPSIKKEIFLGTCSSRTCVKQRNIKNIKLNARFTLSNNSQKTKTLKVK